MTLFQAAPMEHLTAEVKTFVAGRGVVAK